jgi:RNA polymerase sigma factor (sigma-70 family)
LPVAKTYSEQELVALLKQRSNVGFAYLYDYFSGALYTSILNIVPDKDVAADVLQEVYINIFRKIESYDASKGRIYTWMLNIARNEAIDTIRSKAYKNSLQNRDVTNSVYEQTANNTLNIDTIGLRKIMEKIKPEYRVLVDLCYLKGYTQDEISKKENIPLGTVKTRLRAALVQLRELMGVISTFILWIITKKYL